MDRLRARRLACPILAAIGLFGLNSMFGQLYRNGYAARAAAILASPAPLLPDDKTPLLTSYIGVRAVDGLLALAGVLWADVTTGAHPPLSLYAVQFGGQLVPVFLVMMVEGARVGSVRNALYYTVLWGYAMQTFGYAFTMPIYCMLHLFTSSFTSSGKDQATAAALRDPAPFALSALAPAFAVGYLLPSILIALPVSSHALHQWLGAIWQGFPLYVVLYQRLFTWLMQPAVQKSQARVLGAAYDWAFNVAAATQLFSYAVILAAKFFPGLFPGWASEAFTFGSVFGVGPFHSREPLTSMAVAMHDFFRWDQYVGSAAALVWGITLYATADQGGMSVGRWLSLGWDILRWSAVAGPGGALMRLLRRRDEIFLGGQAADGRKSL